MEVGGVIMGRVAFRVVEYKRSEREVLPEVKDHVLLRDEGLCYYCGVLVEMTSHSSPSMGPQSCCLDHIHAYSKGRQNTIDNLVVSCRKCNSEKGAKSVEDYRVMLERRASGVLNTIEYLEEALFEFRIPRHSKITEAIEYLKSQRKRHQFYGEKNEHGASDLMRRAAKGEN